MGQGVALGVDATHTWARINALLIDTRAIHGAFRANNTLRPALGRISLVIRQTRTAGLPVSIKAVAVRAAGGWMAGVAYGRRSCATRITR